MWDFEGIQRKISFISLTIKLVREGEKKTEKETELMTYRLKDRVRKKSKT